MRLFDPPEPTPPKKLLRDPAVASAVAKCIVNTLEPASKLAQQAHPGKCRFCDVDFDRKISALTEFNQWAGWAALDKPPDLVDPDWPEIEPQVEAFMRLPLEEQQRLAAKAAGYDPEEYANTPPEYGRSYPHGKSVTDDKTATGARDTEAQPGQVGGRDRASYRKGRGIGGPEEIEGAAPAGIPDRAPQAPGSNQDDLSVPTDRYRDKSGDQPF